MRKSGSSSTGTGRPREKGAASSPKPPRLAAGWSTPPLSNGSTLAGEAGAVGYEGRRRPRAAAHPPAPAASPRPTSRRSRAPASWPFAFRARYHSASERAMNVFGVAGGDPERDGRGGEEQHPHERGHAGPGSVARRRRWAPRREGARRDGGAELPAGRRRRGGPGSRRRCAEAGLCARASRRRPGRRRGRRRPPGAGPPEPHGVGSARPRTREGRARRTSGGRTRKLRAASGERRSRRASSGRPRGRASPRRRRGASAARRRRPRPRPRGVEAAEEHDGEEEEHDRREEAVAREVTASAVKWRPGNRTGGFVASTGRVADRESEVPVSRATSRMR